MNGASKVPTYLAASPGGALIDLPAGDELMLKLTRLMTAPAMLLTMLCGSVAAQSVAWVQMTDRGAEVRLVTDAASCPAVRVDGARRGMAQRAGPSDAFPDRVCAAVLKPADRRVAVAGQLLRAP